MLDNAPIKVDPLYDIHLGQNVVVVWGGTNDMRHWLHSPEVVYSQLRQYCLERRERGFTVVVMTLLPRSDGTYPAGFEADRQAVNRKIRATWPGFADAFVDVGTDRLIGRLGCELESQVLQWRSGASEQLGARSGRGPGGAVAAAASMLWRRRPSTERRPSTDTVASWHTAHIVRPAVLVYNGRACPGAPRRAHSTAKGGCFGLLPRQGLADRSQRRHGRGRTTEHGMGGALYRRERPAASLHVGVRAAPGRSLVAGESGVSGHRTVRGNQREHGLAPGGRG